MLQGARSVFGSLSGIDENRNWIYLELFLRKNKTLETQHVLQIDRFPMQYE